MTEPALSTRHVATSWVPVVIDGTPRRIAQRIVVVDEGTGAGIELARVLDARLCVATDRAGAGSVHGARSERAAISQDRHPPLGSALREGPPAADVVVRLRPMAEGTGIEVLGPWSERPRPCRRVAVADWVVRMLTRMDLDDHDLHVHLHAGAVADGQGRAVVVLGESGAGKSTIVSHLAHGGLGLITDEQVEVLGDGLVGGFTRPVAIKAGGEQFLPIGAARASDHGALDPGDTRLLTPVDLDTCQQLVGRPVVLVALGRSSGGSAGITPALPPVEALELLCANTLDLVREPVVGLQRLAALVAGLPLVRVTYEDSVDGARMVAELLADPPKLPRVAWSVEVLAHEPAPPAPSGAAHRAADVVTVAIGGDHLLYRGTSRALVRINQAAAALWRALPVSVEESVGAELLLEELRSHGFVVGDPG